MKKTLLIILSFIALSAFFDGSNNDIFKVRLLNSNNNFSKRDGMESLYYHDTTWAMGGWHPDSTPVTYNQVWYSIDNALNFYQKPTGLFTRRHTFALGIKDDKMWIWQGDGAYTSVQNDVYSYSSAAGWVLVTADKGTNGNGRTLAPWTVHKTWLYSISGSSKTDVVRSTDGITWSVVATLPTKMQNLINGTATSFNGNIYVAGGHFDIGGFPLTMNNKVWKSADDGVTWTIAAQSDGDVDFATSYPSMVATSTHLWFMGGASPTGVNTAKLMHSYNGTDWTVMPYNITPRHASGMHVKPGVNGAADDVYIIQGNLQNDSWKIEKINK